MKDLWNDLIEAFTEQGVSEGLATEYLIVSALLIVMIVVAVIMRIVVIVKYSGANKKKTKSGKTGKEIARETLDKMGLRHINVKKAGFLRATFFGNSYSLSKKTIFLRRGIADKNSITSVGMALQKVAIAEMCEKGSGMTITRNVMQILNVFAPVMFVPAILLGFLLDFIIFKTVGVFSVVGIVIGMFLVLTGFIATLLNLPVEKKANDAALRIIRETGVLDAEEQKIIQNVFGAYIVAYVCEFIVAIIRIVQIILEIAINVQASKNNK